MKIPSSDPKSAHQIDPDNAWFISFREGNPTPSWCSKLIWLEHGLQVSYEHFVSRFYIYSKNKSRYKSNHPKQSWSYFLILCSYHWSSHIRCYNGNFKFPCSDSESPQKTSLDTSWTIPNGAGHISWFCAAITDLAILSNTMGISNFPVQIQNLFEKMDLDTNWMIQFKAGHLTLTWCPNHHFGYSRCYKIGISVFRFIISSKNGSRWKLNHPKRRGSILCFPA